MRVGDEQGPIAGQEHLAAPVALDAKGVGQRRSTACHRHVVESIVLDDQDPAAVGLDEVRFVDAQFLNVGTRVVLPFDESLVGGPEAEHRGPATHRVFGQGRRLQHHRAAVPAPIQAVGADPFVGLGLQMDQQLVTRREGDEAGRQLGARHVDRPGGRGATAGQAGTFGVLCTCAGQQHHHQGGQDGA